MHRQSRTQGDSAQNQSSALPVPLPPTQGENSTSALELSNPSFDENPLPRSVSVFIGPGLAHTYYAVGVLKGLADLGIRVEKVGGVEWGALIALLFALDGNVNDLEWRLISLKENCLNSAFRREPSRTEKWIGKVENIFKSPLKKDEWVALGDPACLDEQLSGVLAKRSERTLSDFKVEAGVFVNIQDKGGAQNRWVTHATLPSDLDMRDFFQGVYRVRPYLKSKDVESASDIQLRAAVPEGKWETPALETWLFTGSSPLVIWIESNETVSGAVSRESQYTEDLRRIKLRLSGTRAKAQVKLKAGTGSKAFGATDFTKRNDHAFEGEKSIRQWAQEWVRRSGTRAKSQQQTRE